MNNLEVLKQVKVIEEGYAKAKTTLAELLDKEEDPTLLLAAITNYMKVFGKGNPEGMKEVKELAGLLEK